MKAAWAAGVDPNECAVMAPKVLLVTTVVWPIAARLAGTFAKLGWRVEIVAPRASASRHTRFADTVHGYTGLAPMLSLRRAVRRADADLIVACDDRAVALTARLDAPVVGRSLGAPENYDLLMHRARLIAVAEAAGIRVPRTVEIESEDDLQRALRETGLPAVIKADGSWGGDGIAIVHTREAAREAFCKISARISPWRTLARAVRRNDAHHLAAAFAAQPQLSLQAHIPGTPATAAFACWRGEVLAAIHADVVAGGASGGPASVVRIVQDDAMDAAACKLARRFGLSGLHGLDFIRDREGQVHLIEANPRATPIAALAMGEARDLPAALARASGHASFAPAHAIATDLVALFPNEWLRDPSSAWLCKAHHDVPWDDPPLLRACLAEPQRKHDLPGLRLLAGIISSNNKVLAGAGARPC